MDEMWTLPADWFWPLLGPFTGHMIPDYIGFYFWHEIISPSEWICMAGSVVILAKRIITRSDIPFRPVIWAETRLSYPELFS